MHRVDRHGVVRPHRVVDLQRGQLVQLVHTGYYLKHLSQLHTTQSAPRLTLPITKALGCTPFPLQMCARRPTSRQTDCRVQRPLSCMPIATYPMGGPGSAWLFITGRATTPRCELGRAPLGALELTALHGTDDEVWVPLVKEADVLLANGRDALYLCQWMRESGLAYLFSSLPEMVWAGLSGGSIVMPRVGEDFGSWKSPEGGDRALGVFDFAILPHLDHPDPPGTRWPMQRGGPRACPCRATQSTIRPLSRWSMASAATDGQTPENRASLGCRSHPSTRTGTPGRAVNE